MRRASQHTWKCMASNIAFHVIQQPVSQQCFIVSKNKCKQTTAYTAVHVVHASRDTTCPSVTSPKPCLQPTATHGHSVYGNTAQQCQLSSSSSTATTTKGSLTLCNAALFLRQRAVQVACMCSCVEMWTTGNPRTSNQAQQQQQLQSFVGVDNNPYYFQNETNKSQHSTAAAHT